MPIFGASDNWCCISDLQLPFEAEFALDFVKRVCREFRIDKDHMTNVGDEVDQLFGSQYPKDPDADLSAVAEIRITKDKLRRWTSAFPNMYVAISNHGMRWAKKASAAEIPSQMIRTYQEVLGIPETWRYKYVWIFKEGRQPWMLKHGLGYSGQYPFKQAPIHEGMSVAFGHLHSSAGIARVKTDGYQRDLWGMNTGSLIDPEAFAFAYQREARFKPNLGIGVVVNGGTTPIWIPYEP